MNQDWLWHRKIKCTGILNHNYYYSYSIFVRRRRKIFYGYFYMRAPKARAKIFNEINHKNHTYNSNIFSGKSNKKKYILDFVSLIHNDITWCVPDFLQKERDSLIFPDLKIYCEILWFALTQANLHSAHYRQKKTNWPGKRETIFSKNKKNMWKVGRTHFQKVRPKRKQCAMTGALFSEKCARGNFSAPFAQRRSPNASLRNLEQRIHTKVPRTKWCMNIPKYLKYVRTP